jgi:chorismate mutase
MQEKKDIEDKYYLVKKNAVSPVLKKVIEAKRLLESSKAVSIQEATDAVGISRSSFYKYKDDILTFHDTTKGKTITLLLQMEDVQGLLANVLSLVAKHHSNILTIHQSIPVNGVASLTLSVEIPLAGGDITSMIEGIEKLEGIHSVKVLARE